MKKKRWTEKEDELLSILRTSGVRFDVISQILHRSEHSINVRASRLKISAPRRNEIDDSELSDNQDVFKKIDSKTVGTINEDEVKIKLATLGYDVFLPYMNNHKTDLVVIHKDKVCKLQVKSASYEQSNRRFRAQLRTKDKSNSFVSYSESDVISKIKVSIIKEFIRIKGAQSKNAKIKIIKK